MSQVIGAGPLQELDLCDGFRPYSNTLLLGSARLLRSCDNENQPHITDTETQEAPKTQTDISGVFEARIESRSVPKAFVVQNFKHHEENRVENAQSQQRQGRSERGR